MISCVRKPAVIRRFKIWDLEWEPGTYILRVCGVFDPDNGYRAYHSIDEFLAHELTHENSGTWFYAHFGGGADLQFLIERFKHHPAFTVRGSFSGSSCVVCSVRYKRWTFVFVDSYWLLRSPLKEIAKSLGLVKTGPTDSMSEEQRRRWYKEVDQPTLEEYNRNDCEVLWKAIHRAQCAILEMGGQLQMTLASTAMQLFRRNYLKEDIPTSRSINETARLAYVASRVEVHRRWVNFGEAGLSSDEYYLSDTRYFDVNSSFPHAMTFPLPGRLHGNYSSLPDFAWNLGYPYLLDCDIEVPESEIPPLPLRHGGRVFFPTGRWRAWVTGIDVSLLLREGGRILRVYGCKVFEPFTDLSDYAQDLYRRRAATDDPFERDFYKLLMNAAYGKFAESSTKSTLIMHPSASVVAAIPRENMLFPGVFFKSSEVPIAHAHVPISAYITAIARETLYNAMSSVSEVHYCDTDGFSTSDELATGPGLGLLKLEKSFGSADFIVPKLYRWQPTEGAAVVRAKGFSLSKEEGQATKQFDHMVEGGEIRIERMMRIRENLRSGDPKPKDKVIVKRLRQIDFLDGVYDANAMPKRFMYPDGHTRAWTVEELTGGAKLPRSKGAKKDK